MIHLRNLEKTIEGRKILSSLTVSFDEGNIYGIIGANGVGKTTFFRCIAGLTSFSGYVNAERKPLKHHLGYLPAELYFLPKITGEEYLILIAKGRGEKLPEQSTYNIFNLPLDKYIETYSTGMKKKLGLTSIFMLKNTYYILDEPYNGLDFESSMMLTEILLELRSLNKVVLISSHIFSTLKDTCDTIFLLENGKLVNETTRENFSLLENQLKDKILRKDVRVLLG